jgi:Holliday junction resolvase RusA-like endonuclease
MTHTWVVLGDPVGKGRPRFAVRGNHAVAYTPERTRNWEAIAREVFACHWDGPPYEGAAALSVTAVFARPKRLMRAKDSDDRLWHTSMPDTDNVVKAVADALEQAGVVRNDSQIVQVTACKLYSAKAEGPRVEVTMTTF